MLLCVAAFSFSGCKDDNANRYTRVEGSSLKMMRHYVNTFEEGVTKEICDTFYDQAKRHPECSTGELLARVTGTDKYGKKMVVETRMSGIDLAEIRKYEGGTEYWLANKGYVAMDFSRGEKRICQEDE